MANIVDKAIKKIFRSYDFKGNKILNAKVNTPTNPEDISSKGFVDLSVTYNTTTATTKKDSTTFSWMTGLNGLTVKQVLDKLLFNVSLPVFKNPALNDIVIYPDDTQLFGLQYIVFNGAILKGKFKYDLSITDRPVLSNTILKVTYPDTSFQVFEDADNDGIIDFEFIFDKNCTFELTRTYDQAPPKKLEDGVTDYIAPGFDVQYDMIIDITGGFKKNLIIYQSPLISLIRSEVGIPTYDSIYITENFTIGTSKTFSKNVELIYDLLIPSEIINMSTKYKYLVGFNFYDTNGNYMFDTLLPLNLLTRFTNSETITHNGIEYIKYQYNFGVIHFDGKFVIDFTNIRNSEHLINQ